MAETTYQQPPVNYQPSAAPVGQVKSNRSLLKLILLGIVTLGIYPIVFFSGISTDINIIASRYDGKKTMHYCLLFFLIGPITAGIAYLVWFHKITGRIGNELSRRSIPYSFGSKDYWLWSVLGSLIVVGPFIFLYKLAKATNMLAEHYNVNG
jgi:ABC-type sulfate transport system permease subunit